MRESSREAHEIIKPHKATHYEIIKGAMKDIGKPSISKEIAKYCNNLEYHDVAKRLSEMEKRETVKVVGRAYDVPKRPLLWDLITD